MESVDGRACVVALDEAAGVRDFCPLAVGEPGREFAGVFGQEHFAVGAAQYQRRAGDVGYVRPECFEPLDLFIVLPSVLAGGLDGPRIPFLRPCPVELPAEVVDQAVAQDVRVQAVVEPGCLVLAVGGRCEGCGPG